MTLPELICDTAHHGFTSASGWTPPPCVRCGRPVWPNRSMSWERAPNVRVYSHLLKPESP